MPIIGAAILHRVPTSLFVDRACPLDFLHMPERLESGRISKTGAAPSMLPTDRPWSYFTKTASKQFKDEIAQEKAEAFLRGDKECRMQRRASHLLRHTLLPVLALSLLLTACGGSAPTAAPVDPNALATRAVATLYAGMTQTVQAVPPTPTPTATAVRTPPALPGVYVPTDYLNPLDVPRAYIQEPCQVLRDRWTSTNAAPGTVVMVIMFHSIVAPGGTASDSNQIEAARFEVLMRDLHDQGFVAIDAARLADFLDHNAAIPARSVLLVVDDRHYAQYFDTYFRPYYEQWGWPVVNAWISLEDSIGAAALPENMALSQEGWVDYQAHGVVHNTPISEAVGEDYMISELQGSLDLITANFGRPPVAYIWPGGGFTPRSAELAGEIGYRLGFTINPRGPLMYNWIPLSDTHDPARPSYLPEGAVADPRLVLPRYWSYDADLQIDNVRAIGQGAALYAEAGKAVELEYYDIVCAPTYGPIP